MITKEDLKNEIEQLDDSYLDLVFRLLQHYHIKKNKPDLLACSRPIHYPDDEISDGTAFSDIENTAEYGKQLRTTAWQRNHG
jgi:hypothetical protein